MKWTTKTIPSLSRYLDTELTAEVVPGEPTTRDYQLYTTFSFPTDEMEKLSPVVLNEKYFQPAVKALAEKINSMGKVKTAPLPLPEGMVAFNCTKGKIPVTLIVVRHMYPDRHQFFISILVEPVNEA